MKADTNLYRELQTTLNAAAEIISKISDTEAPSTVNLRLIPIKNRITAFNEWMNDAGEKAAGKAEAREIRTYLKSKEGKAEILALYKEIKAKKVAPETKKE